MMKVNGDRFGSSSKTVDSETTESKSSDVPSTMLNYLENSRKAQMFYQESEESTSNYSLDFETVNVFEKKEFFPAQLRNYIELLNKLWERQNEILSSTGNLIHARKPLQFPFVDRGNELQKEFIKNDQIDPILFNEKDVVKYLIKDVKEFDKPADKEITVALAAVPGKKQGTAKKAKEKKTDKKGKSRKKSERGKSVKSGKREKSKKSKDTGKESKRGKSEKGKSKRGRGKGSKGEAKDKLVEKSANITAKEYELSELQNLKDGYTAVPNETLLGKIILFRAEPANPDLSCFRMRSVEEKHFYTPDLLAALFKTDGSGFVQYPNRETAIDITIGRIGKKLVVYSESAKDEDIYRETVPLAIFDDYGNGVVFDKHGNIRLNYDQCEGVLYDTPKKIPLFWTWSNSQFLMQRRKDLKFVEVDDPDNDIPEESIPSDAEEEVVSIKKIKGDKDKPKGGKRKSAKGKSAPGTKKKRKSAKKSLKATSKKSLKGKGKKSGKGTGKKSAKGTGKKSAKGTGKKSAKGTGKKSAKGTGKKSAKGTGKKTDKDENKKGKSAKDKGKKGKSAKNKNKKGKKSIRDTDPFGMDRTSKIEPELRTSLEDKDSKKRSKSVKSQKRQKSVRATKGRRRKSKAAADLGKDEEVSIEAAAKLNKIRAILDFKKYSNDRKRLLPPISKPPKVLIPITQIKPLVMKITNHIAIRILHQGHIHIDFTYHPVHLSLHIGVKIYPTFLERIDKIIRKPNDKRKVPCYFEFLCKRTNSLFNLHNKRLEMKQVWKNERFRKYVKEAYTMGSYIYLKKKASFVKGEVQTLPNKE